MARLGTRFDVLPIHTYRGTSKRQHTQCDPIQKHATSKAEAVRSMAEAWHKQGTSTIVQQRTEHHTCRSSRLLLRSPIWMADAQGNLTAHSKGQALQQSRIAYGRLPPRPETKNVNAFSNTFTPFIRDNHSVHSLCVSMLFFRPRQFLAIFGVKSEYFTL